VSVLRRPVWEYKSTAPPEVLQKHQKVMHARAVLTLLFALATGAGTRGVADDRTRFVPVVDTPIGKRVFDELGDYYAARDAKKYEPERIPHEKMVERLGSADADERREAGEYLHALCLQTDADDRSGRTPRPHGMKLGPSPSWYGAEMRGWMARELARAKLAGSGAEAFDAARWLYENDTWPDHREDGVRALAMIRTPEADRVFLDIVREAEGHFDILTMAIGQVAEMELPAPPDDIRALCRHYNENVRNAARKAAGRLGVRDLPKYDRRTDLGARLEKWLRALLEALPDKVPPGARWCRLTAPATYLFFGSDEEKTELCGWLIGEEGNTYRVIDWEGQPRSWTRTEVKIRSDSLKAFAKRVEKTTKSFNASEDCDKKRKLQQQLGIQTFGISSRAVWQGSLPEALVAAWALERGDRETAARLMVPLMRDTSDVFVPNAEDLLGVAIETLLKIDDPRVCQFLATYCGRKPRRGFEPSADTWQRLFLAGHEPTLDRLFALLDDRTPAYEGSDEPLGDNWLSWLSAWRYENVPNEVYSVPAEKREALHADLKDWLRAQFKLIRQGKPNQVRETDLHLPWGHWRSYSTGWVRRI